MLASNIDVDLAIEKTLEISKQEIELQDKFSKYAPIYIASTSNVKSTIDLYKAKIPKIDKALIVGSQGAYAYELALKCGTKKIDCFDKNILQYLFFAFYNAGIKVCDYSDFIRNFTSTKISTGLQCFDDMFDDWVLFDVLENMKGIEREYWAKLYKKKEIRSLLKSNLFRTTYPLYLEYLKKYSSVYDIKSYHQLQKLLLSNQLEINYHICELYEIHQEFKNEHYDLIIFDNILQYYQTIPTLNNVMAVNSYCRNKWSSLLNEKGFLQLGYGFEVVADAVKQILGGKNTALPKDMISFMKQFSINKDIEEGFISNFVKKYYKNQEWDYYILDFIPAVEENDGHVNSENIILSYKK